jgi:hypothetical protein
MRILITGSRSWTKERLLCNVLDQYRDRNPKLPERHILVSGACPTGADAMAEAYAHDVGWHVERHPADWDTHGKRAGYVRNAEMVHRGADVCLAFIQNNSKGASMTADIAQKAGIETHIYRDDYKVSLRKDWYV